MDVTVIRPFLYVDEKDIKGFAARENIPVMKSKCPADGNTKRENMKQLIKNLEKDMENVAELISIEEDLAAVKGEMDEVNALLDERIEIEKETLDIKAKE